MGWLRSIFEDWDFRSGVKFALAGCLSFYVALLLRLENPGWAVITAFVLCVPRYLGAVVEKMVLRMVGTLAGAITGYLLTGSLQQNPVIFLTSMALLAWLTTALYGGTFIPYFFRMLGFTSVVIAADGLSNPADSWQIGLWRCQEVMLGVGVTTAVTWLVWPRYARFDFVLGVRQVLVSLRDDLAAQPLAFGGADNKISEQKLMPTVRRMQALEKMIRLGLMESKNFRMAEDKVNEVVGHVGGMSIALARLGQSLPEDSPYRPYLEKPAQRLHAAFLQCLDSLVELESEAEKERSLESARLELEAAWAEYDGAIDRFTVHRVGDLLTTEESLNHAAYFAAASSLREEIPALMKLRHMLEMWEAETLPVIRLEKYRRPTREWWIAGVRAAVTVVCAFILLNWLDPPGGPLLVVGSYLFTGFMLESTDRRFDAAIIAWFGGTTLFCLGYFLLLLIIAPWLSLFWFQMLVLGVILYLVGVQGNRGAWSQEKQYLIMLVVGTMLGLNAQEPVDFQAVVGASFGLFLSAALTTVVRRTVFPFLPQEMFRQKLRRMLRLDREFLADFPGELQAAQRREFLLTSADTSQNLPILEKGVWGPERAARWRKVFRAVYLLGVPFCLRKNLGCFPWGELPETERAVAEDWLNQWKRRASDWEQMLTRAEPWQEKPVRPTRKEMEEWVARIRQWIRAPRAPLDRTMMQLGALHAWTLLAEASDEGATAVAAVDPAIDFRDTKI